MAGMADGLLQDLRYGLRTLAKSPVFTIVAVASLAIGIGVNISIFGFANAALFKPVAVERPGELVSLYHRNEKGGENSFPAPIRNTSSTAITIPRSPACWRTFGRR